ncbi:transposase [Hymenobacter sp. BRD67]|uniref:transposase n=1 Tax=Hymenobacter sp. BRD67 TaxID=2675877 RepID=UPI00156654A8|nr:transposase [Hymenobacter sp. BRD67]
MPTTEKSESGGSPSTRKTYTPAFKTEGVRQVAAGDVARTQGISPALLGRWQRPCPAARSATKSSSSGPRSNAWKWSAIFKKVVTSNRLRRGISQPPHP